MYVYNSLCIYTEAGCLEENDCTLLPVSLFVMKEGVFICLKESRGAMREK